MSHLSINESAVFHRIKNTVRILGKYCSTSLIATSADFAIFHIAITYISLIPVQATVAGRLTGAMVAFWLQRSWVFRSSGRRSGNMLRIMYVTGILIGMGLNVAGVWLLNGFLELEPWPARITAAVAAWYFGFMFNKKMVFG